MSQPTLKPFRQTCKVPCKTSYRDVFHIPDSSNKWMNGLGYALSWHVLHFAQSWRIEILCIWSMLSKKNYTDRKNCIEMLCDDCSKGQLISKCLFGVFNSSKKRMKKFDLTTMIPLVDLFSFVFWENWRHRKDISKLTDPFRMSKILKTWWGPALMVPYVPVALVYIIIGICSCIP